MYSCCNILANLRDSQQSRNASDGHTKTDFFHSNQPTVPFFSAVNQVPFKYVQNDPRSVFIEQFNGVSNR